MVDRKAKSGFTILDLLVVLAGGAILISMLLPGIQSARDISRDGQCKDRLRKIAIGALLYESALEKLPAELSPVGAVPLSGWTSSIGSDSFYNNQHTSVLVQIAPFMGLGELLDQVDPFILDFDNDLTDQDVYADIIHLWFWGDSGANNLMVDIPEFTCPTDNINQVLAHASGQSVALYVSSPDVEDWFGEVIWLSSEGDGRYAGTRTQLCGLFWR